MPLPRRELLNTPAIEIWPGGLLRARASHDARILARARHVLRRKRDGRYLAADLPEGLMPLVPSLPREPGIAGALDALGTSCARFPRGGGRRAAGTLPMRRLEEHLDRLGLDPAGYAARSGLQPMPEPDWLAWAGVDRYRRALWLDAAAAEAWRRMQDAARSDGILLEAVSGYRSHDYQAGIFARKLARGLALERILAVNAAPGFSEHHTGLALDIGTPGEPPAEESFERTPAFRWLADRAGDHGFAMSYPRDNPHGIVYEPWHWRFAG